MSVRTALLAASVALLSLLALAPAAAAGTLATTDASVEPAAQECLAASPPCGYIVPALSLEFPDKPTCRAKSLGAALDLSQCIPLPALGSSYATEGRLVMSWDVTQDGTYPADPSCAAPTVGVPPAPGPCIVITFSGTATNPKWMSLAVEPAEVTLSQADLLTNLQVNQETQQVMFWFEIPLKVTFTRTGEPDEDGLARIDRSQGVTQMFLKAKSSASGAYLREAFGVEEFRFSSCAPEAGLADDLAACGAVTTSEAPGAGLAAALAAVGAVAIVARRRRQA